MRKNLERRISYAGYEKQIPGIVYFMRSVFLIICGNQKGKGKMEILRTENLKKYYDQNMVCVKALDGVSLSVEQGEFVAIVGTSGSGKSTLLHMLGGLDRPTSGTVLVDGKRIFDLEDGELTIFRRRKIGFVFQAYNLVPVLNVYENIVLPI